MLTLVMLLGLSLALFAQATDLFFSEYVEGASNNKALEIFNGTGSTVDLSNYKVRLASNGNAWSETNSVTLTGTLANNDVFVIANSAANATILGVADLTHTVTYFNGNDALGLFKIVGGNDVLIDMIGVYQQDPGTAWPVAGVDGATLNHTLIRKPYVISGNTDFLAGAGTTVDNSEWLVHPQDYVTDLGMHDFNPGGGQGAATPVFNPPAGAYTQPISVSLTSETAGAQIYYTTNGNNPDQSSTLYTAPIAVSTTTTIKARAYATGMDPSNIATANYVFAQQVSNLGQLRSQAAGTGTVYRVSGEVVLTYKQSFRNQKYVQDSTGAILIDDPSGVLATNYNVNDGITGLVGTIAFYTGMLQFTPTLNPGAATSTNNQVHIPVVSIATLNANFANYQGRLVKLNGANFVGASGNFASGTNYNVADASGQIVLRTQFYEADYIDTPIPSGAFSVNVICLQFNTTNQVVPRYLSDFGPVPNEDPTNAPVVANLIGNYPNPFNPETTIVFSTGKAEAVQFEIYNHKGQLVRSFEVLTNDKGVHQTTWNGTDDKGNSVSSGVYYFRMKSGKFSSTKKMVLMK